MKLVHTVFQEPAWDVVWACGLVGLDHLEGPLNIFRSNTGGLLVLWQSESGAKRIVGGFKMSTKGVKSIRERQVFGALCVSSVVVSDALNTLPHAPRFVGEEVTLPLLMAAIRFLLAALSATASPDLNSESWALRRDLTSAFSQGFWLGWILIVVVEVTSSMH